MRRGFRIRRARDAPAWEKPVGLFLAGYPLWGEFRWPRLGEGGKPTLKRHFAQRSKLARLCTAETYSEPQRTRETPALSMSHGKAKPKAKSLR